MLASGLALAVSIVKVYKCDWNPSEILSRHLIYVVCPGLAYINIVNIRNMTEILSC